MNSSRIIIQFLATTLFLGLLNASGYSQTTAATKYYTTSGSVIFGAGVSTVNVSMWGGGGGGSAGGMKQFVNATDYILHSGGGGGGSNWAGNSLLVSPGYSYNVYVGAGGYGGGFDGNGLPLSGGDGGTSGFQGVYSFGGYAGIVSGYNGVGGLRAPNSVPDAGAPYAQNGGNAESTQGGNGGLSNAGPYGVSGPFTLYSGLGYPQVAGISTGGPGLNPGDGGGGGGYTTLPWPFEYFLSQRKAGGNGANGIVTFYISYPTYRLTAPTTATKLCGSGVSTITLHSTSLSSGTYTVTYNTTNPVTTGNIAIMTFDGNANTGSFTTVPLFATTTITITNLASGNTCSDAINQFNTVSVIVENLTANDWNPQIEFGGSGRSNAVAFSIGTKAYVGTGKNGSTLLNDFWQFDQTTNTWTQLANFGGSARSDAAGFAVGTKGYIGTGYDGSYKNDFFEYDPFTNVWTAKSNFPGISRSNASSMSIGNKGYIGTGINGSSYFNDFFEYDPLTNAWTGKASFAWGIAGSGRSSATAFSINNKGYLGLGFNGSVLCKDLWEFNPTTNQWSSKTALTGVARSGAPGFCIGSKGYVGTGWNGSAGLNDFYEYDPASNAWTTMANFNGSARRLAVGFCIGSKGYIGLGLALSTYSKEMFEFSPVNTSITTGALSINSACTGSAITIPFTVGCMNFSSGNIFTAQLSDAFGSFANPVTIGTTSFAGGSINGIIPANALPGAGYRIRIDGSNPATTGTDNGTNIGIKPAVTTSVTAGISNNNICRGDSINLTATVTSTATNDTTVILTENFNAEAPLWLKTSAGSYTYLNPWIYTNGQHGYYSNDNSSFYATISSGQPSNAITSTTLQSPMFSTLGMNSGTLTFYHHYQYGNYNSGDSIKIQASIDNGQSWITLYLNNSTTIGDPQDSLGFVKQTISLNNVMNQPSVVLRFNYGALGGLGKWLIDNIVIKGISKSNNFSWSSIPAGFSSTLQNPTGIIPTLVPGITNYTVTFANNFGCGTVSNTVSVTVKDTSSSTTTISICPDQLPYIWNGLTFSGAGSQIKHLINSVGCDSAAKLILIVKAVSTSATTINICPNELPYTWNGLVFNTAGSQTAHFINSVGCDSAATLNLIVKPVSSYTTNLTLCQTSLPYSWNGYTFNAAGSHTAHFINSVGCDSAVTMNLVIVSSSVIASSNLTSVCPGALINLSASSVSGSAVTILNEKFNNTNNNWTTINQGSGGIVDSASWQLKPSGYEPYFGLNGFVSNDNSPFYLSNSYAQGPGVTTHTTLQSPEFSTLGLSTASLSFYHHFSHQSTFANDSIRVQISTNGTTWTNLYVNKTTTVGTTATFQPQTISLNGYLNLPALRIRFVYNGTPIAGGFSNYWWAIDNVSITGMLSATTYSWSSVPGGFTSALQNPAPFSPVQTTTYNVIATNGFCTAISGVNVTVNITNPTSASAIEICPGSLPYVWNGLTFYSGGTQTAHILTAGGCDSAATLTVTVKAASSSTTNITICPAGIPYTWNGLVFNAAGSQTKYLINSVGCDSAALLNLYVQTSSTSSVNTISICETQLPYSWNELTFTGTGRQTKMLTNIFGCDSAATLNLIVFPKPGSVVAGVSVPQTCAGTAVNLSASSVSNTILLNENFNGGTNSWITQNLSTGGVPSAAAWTLRPDGYQLLGGAVTFHSNDNTAFYLSDSYSQGSAGITNTTLQSPAFSTVGYSSASLTFYHMYSRRDANDSVRVQITTDNGGTWTTVYINKTSSVGNYGSFMLQTVSLNSYINMSSLMLRFQYGAAGDFMWAVDNVKVLGTALPTSYAWSSVPSGFNSVLQNPSGVLPLEPTIYKVIATNSNGCSDSNQVAITVKSGSSSSGSLNICASLLPYTWNGLTFNTAGTQTAHLVNSIGCDSAASLTLYVNSASTSSNTITICQSALPYSWNGLTFNSADTQTAHLLNSVGCDSAATLTLAVTAAPAGVTANASSTTVCAGTSINLTATGSSGATSIILNENFNAPVNNWIRTNTSTGSNASVVAWTLRPNGYMPEPSNDNSQIYLSHAGALDYGSITHTTLQSPVFSTVGFSNASLSFYHSYVHNVYDFDSIRVQISTDGLTWSNIYLNKTTDVGVDYLFVQQTISLNSYLNQANLRLRFNYNAAWGANWWAIDNVVVTGSPLGNFSWTSSPEGFTSSLQNPTGIIPDQTTTYNLSVSNAGGCITTQSVLVTVNPAPSATIIYSESPYCTTDGIVQVAHTGTNGGLYSAPTGLLLNVTTGAITLTGSTPGTYIVTYTIPASGTCPLYTTTATITVEACNTTTELSIKAFLQGLYIGGETMLACLYNHGLNTDSTAADYINVSLWSPANLGNIWPDYSVTTLLHTNGMASITLPPGASGNMYYIVIKHRNSLETWSKIPVTFSPVTFFDFTTGVN